MRYELRPMSFGDILDGAFKLYRDHFVTFLAIAAIPTILVQLLTGLLFPDFVGQPKPQVDVGRAMGFAGTMMIVGSVLYWIETAALTVVVADVYLGRPSGFSSAYRRAWRVLGKLIAASLVWTLAVMGGLMLLIIPGVLLMFRWLLYAQVLVVEEVDVGDSLRRSRDLTRGLKGKLFLLMLVVGLVSIAITLGAQALAQPLARQIPVLGALIQGVPQILFAPLSSAVMTLAYFDARIRKEGFDLQVLAREVLGGKE